MDLLHSVINGRYRLQRQLGATTFAADEMENRRVVRLVALHLRRLAQDPREPPFAPQFDTLSAVPHPTLLAFLGVGEVRSGDASGCLYWVEELGEHHADRLSGDDLLAVARMLVTALRYLHAAGHLHLNLKPSNLIFSQGTWKLGGLAEVPATAGDLIACHAVSDTLSLVAPEVWRGRVSSAADVWMLGATLQAVGAGQWPFTASTLPGMVQAVLSSPPTVDSLSLPPPLDLIVQGCLIREHERRWPLARIEAVLHGRSYLSPLATARPEPRRRDKRPSGVKDILRVECRQPVSSLAYHGDGTLAAGTSSGTVLVWEHSELLWSAQIGSPILRVRWSPTGLLAVCLEQGECRLYQVHGQLVSLVGDLGVCSDVAFDDQDDRLWLAVGARQVVLWDRSAQARRREIECPRVWSLSHREGRLYAASLDGTVYEWNGEKSRRERRHRGPVLSIQATPRGLVSGGWDGAVFLGQTELPLEAEEDTASYGVFCVDATDKMVVAACEDKHVRFWPVATAPPVVAPSHTAAVHAIAINADGTRVASGSRDGALRIWVLSD